MERLVVISAAVAALAVGCRSIEHLVDEPDPLDGGADTDTDADVDTDTDADTDADTDSDSDADTGTVSDTGTSTAGPCSAVDILFVVQQHDDTFNQVHSQLADAVPGFVSALWDWLPAGTSIHAGLTTGDFSDQEFCSAAYVNCYPDVDAGTLDEIPDHYTTPDVLETTDNGGQGRLFVHDDAPYVEAETPSGVDEATLSLWLMGAIDALGMSGCSYVMYAAATGWSAHPTNGEANAGFLRDAGAVLLIVFVGNLPDVSPGSFADYRAMIAAAKPTCGVDQCTLAAALVWEACIAYSSPYSPSTFLELFGESPLLGDVDEPSDFPLVLGGDLAQQVAETCEAIGPG